MWRNVRLIPQRWDDAILYAPHAHWKDGPTSVFWNGPVARIIPGLEKALNDQR